MQSPSPQDFNHSLHPSLHCVRVLSFPFSFIFYFLTSFISIPPCLFTRSILRTGDSAKQMVRQKTDLQCVQRAHNEGREGRAKKKKERARRMREIESRKAEEEKKFINHQRGHPSFSRCRRQWRKRIFPHLTLQYVLIGQREDLSHGKLVIIGTVSVSLGC